MKSHIILFFSLVATLFSCNDKPPSASVSGREIMLDSLPGDCPYLTKDTKGRTVVSWVRMVNDSTTLFCYAVSKDGKTFSKPVTVPESNHIQPHGENLPKVIFKPSGEIICLWGAANPNPRNKYSGLVFYVQSFDDGKTWTSPKPLVNDTASYDQRYYDVALLPNGEAGIIWLDNRKTTGQEGSGLYFASTHAGHGFVQDRLIGQPCCQCCRTKLFIDRKGYIHALYRGIVQDSIRDMVHIMSTDIGKTFSEPIRISDDNWVINGCPHTGPDMTESDDGLQFAWFTGGKNGGCYHARSTDNGLSFSPRSAVSEFGSHPQLASLANNEVLIVWDETVEVGKRYYKQIGFQKRNDNHARITTQFITPDTMTASYPVITAAGGNNAIVAYSIKKQNRNHVAYQIIN